MNFSALKKFKLFFKLTAVLGFGAVLLTGCQPTREEICRGMRESQSEIHSVRTDLEPASVIETPAGRKLASLTGSHPEGPTESESRKWLKWSEKELKQAQWARDALENDRVGRKGLPALGEATLSFVSFHGYVTQGKWRKAYLALEKAEIGVSLASETVCGRP